MICSLNAPSESSLHLKQMLKEKKSILECNSAILESVSDYRDNVMQILHVHLSLLHENHVPECWPHAQIQLTILHRF